MRDPFCEARNIILYCPDVIGFKDNRAREWNGSVRLEGDFFGGNHNDINENVVFLSVEEGAFVYH